MTLPRVLLFTSRLGGGGAEKHVVRLANYLASTGRWRVHLAVARPGGSYGREVSPHVRVYSLRDRGGATISMALSVRPLRKLIDRLKPAAVFSFLNHATIAAGQAILSSSWRPRFIAGIQNSPDRNFETMKPAMALATRSLMVRRLRLADRIVCLSERVRVSVVSQFPGLLPRLTVIPNIGFDKRVQEEAENRVSRGAGPILVTCGRLHPQKGYPVLLDAFSKLSTERSAELWILGDGPMKNELAGRAKRLGLEDRIRFLGFVDNPYPYFASADLFVLASLYEGFGLVVTEAMSCNVPVVATACEGPSEIIRSGENGLLVPPGDVEALAQGMVVGLRPSGPSATWKRNARESLSRYAPDTVGKQYEQLIDARTS